MSLNDQIAKTQAEITAPENVLPFPYPFTENGELLVVSDDRGILVETTDYSVTGAGTDDLGEVTMIAATIGEIVTIVRQTPRSQTLTLRINGEYFIEDIESALNKLTKIAQEQDERLSRCIQAPVIEIVGYNFQLPAADDRANKVLGFDGSGNLTLIDQ